MEALKRSVLDGSFISYLQRRPTDRQQLHRMLQGVLELGWVSPSRACKVVGQLVSELGVDLNAAAFPAAGNLTPAEMALYQPQVLEHMIGLGLQVNKHLPPGGGTLLHSLVMLWSQLHQAPKYYAAVLQSLQLLLRSGASANARDLAGHPALEYALRLPDGADLRVVSELLPATSCLPLCVDLAAGELLHALKRPAKDVVNELVKLCHGDLAQVPQQRLDLLLTAVERRLPSLDSLLMLLPLAGLERYIEWFVKAGENQETLQDPRRATMSYEDPRLLCGPGSPVNAALASRFKAQLAAHPEHLGLWAILSVSKALRGEVARDEACWQTLPLGAKALLHRLEAAGVAMPSVASVAEPGAEPTGGQQLAPPLPLPRGLDRVARLVVRLVSVIMMETDSLTLPRGTHPFLAVCMHAEHWRDIVRLCLVPGLMDDGEVLVQLAAPPLSELLSWDLAVTPELLAGMAEPAGAWRGFAELFCRQVKKLLKTSVQGRELFQQNYYAVSCLTTLLLNGRLVEEMADDAVTRRVVERQLQRGSDEDKAAHVQTVMATTKSSMVALLASPLGQLLRELHSRRHVPPLGMVPGDWTALQDMLDSVLGPLAAAFRPKPFSHELIAQLAAEKAIAVQAVETEAHELKGCLDKAAQYARVNKKLHIEVCSYCDKAPVEVAIAPGASAKLSRCSGCQVARYCGRECQLAHWKAGHKQECKQRRDERVRAEQQQVMAAQEAGAPKP